jgi:hypothetical protein
MAARAISNALAYGLWPLATGMLSSLSQRSRASRRTVFLSYLPHDPGSLAHIACRADLRHIGVAVAKYNLRGFETVLPAYGRSRRVAKAVGRPPRHASLLTGSRDGYVVPCLRVAVTPGLCREACSTSGVRKAVCVNGSADRAVIVAITGTHHGETHRWRGRSLP